MTKSGGGGSLQGVGAVPTIPTKSPGDPGPTPYWQPPPHTEEVSRVVSDYEHSELALDISPECGISPHGCVPGFRW